MQDLTNNKVVGLLLDAYAEQLAVIFDNQVKAVQEAHDKCMKNFKEVPDELVTGSETNKNILGYYTTISSHSLIVQELSSFIDELRKNAKILINE